MRPVYRAVLRADRREVERRDARLRVLHGLLLLQGQPPGQRLADHGGLCGGKLCGAVRLLADRRGAYAHGQRAGHRHRPLLRKRSVSGSTACPAASRTAYPSWRSS